MFEPRRPAKEVGAVVVVHDHRLKAIKSTLECFDQSSFHDRLVLAFTDQIQMFELTFI